MSPKFLFTIEPVIIENLQSKNVIMIYPNPSSNIIHIESSKLENGLKATFVLCDIHGKKLINHIFSFSQIQLDIDVNKLSNVMCFYIYGKEEEL